MLEKRRYETTFIINGGLEEFLVRQLTKEVLNLIRNNGGEIIAWQQMGRRRLAYPIEKKVNGYYIYVYYDAPPLLPALLERFFRLEENILRFLTVKLDKRGIAYRDRWIAEKGLSAPTESDYQMEEVQEAIAAEEDIAVAPTTTEDASEPSAADEANADTEPETAETTDVESSQEEQP